MLALVPAAIFSFLAGAALFGPGRRGLTMLRESPIKGIALIRWRRFVVVMAKHPRDYRSPRGQYGMYGMGMRSLSDVGFAGEARKADLGAETGVWVASWKDPLTEDIFLGSERLQDEAFARSMRKLLPAVAGFVGHDIDGVKCTLSGLLGVGHHAGAKGTRSWVEDPEIRRKFKATTDTFRKANGIF
jgi:hypothetical protein